MVHRPTRDEHGFCELGADDHSWYLPCDSSDLPEIARQAWVLMNADEQGAFLEAINSAAGANLWLEAHEVDRPGG